MIARGTALCFALSQAAQEGILNENLDLIRKAATVIRTSDVIFLQVYSNIWEPLDAYPLDRLKEAAHPDAVAHFASNSQPFDIPIVKGRDFYAPIRFRPTQDSPEVTIGYAR